MVSFGCAGSCVSVVIILLFGVLIERVVLRGLELSVERDKII